MFPRCISLPKDHSFFLFGPRGVGKTTLLKERLPAAQTYSFDLLDYDLERRLLERPREFREILDSLPPSIGWVVVDEVQKLPFLLDEVHRQIEKNPSRRFALTGSSARKLKRGQANLLAGRAFTAALGPLTTLEIGDAFHLPEALAYGTLPKALTLNDPEDRKRYLRTYAQTYLKEEVQMEGLVRQLPAFRRFLPLAALENGRVLSWANFAQDVGMDAKTARSYFEILEDTLLGFILPAFRRSLRQRQRTHPKFYFFDSGVKRALCNELNAELSPGAEAYGRAFEHFWITEIVRLNGYQEADFVFSYFATHDVEIDLVIERPARPTLFLEIKSAERVRDSDLQPLASVVGGAKDSEGICLSREPRKRRVGPVLVVPWQEVLETLGLRRDRLVK